MELIKKFDLAFEKMASSLLIVIFGLIMLLTILGMFFRILGENISWSGPLSYHLILLGAFLGGVVSISKKMIINLMLKRIILFFSMIVLLALMKSGMEFTLIESEFSKVVFWGISSSYLSFIVSFGLGLITLRVFIHFILSFKLHTGEV